MYLQANLIAVVANKTNSTAYFYCSRKKCVLPVVISSETSFSLLVTQQKLLYDCISNYSNVCNDSGLIHSLIITAEVKCDSKFLDKYAIKVTKKLIEKSLSGLES